VLYRYSEVLRTGLLISDLLLVGGSWMAAYLIRFHAAGLPEPPVAQTPDVASYALVLPVILPVWLLLFRSRGLYHARRAKSPGDEAGRIVQATGMGVLVLVTIGFFSRSYEYSRLVILIFAGLSSTSVILSRGIGRLALARLRRRGYNLRYVVIIGAGELAREVIERLRTHPEAGLRLLGVVADDTTQRAVGGVPIVSPLGQLKEYLGEESHQLEKVLAALDDETASVQLVPDLRHVLTLRSTVEDLEGLPVIGLRQSPLVGMAAVYKRCFDLAMAGAGLLLLSPLLALLAVATKLGSRGPVFYRQERMGLDGRVFHMLKFRTMRVDAEQDCGPVWTSDDDPRRTRLGRWLRRLSLDELPQLWNVLRGEMSIVGPRPERPVFIEQFRHEIPGYMLRHKVKAGMTGWAQVHGWRGNTSLHERIEHDIHYIQNWSIGLDIRILFLTIGHLLRPRNAY